MTVGEIVAKNVAFAEIFEKYGIDFCCGGDVSFIEICEKNNITPAAKYTIKMLCIRKNQL